AKRWNGHRGNLANAPHAHITRFINARLNGKHTGQIDLVYFLVTALDFASDPQCLTVEDLDGIHQGCEWIVQHRSKHSTNLSGPILGLYASKNELVVALLDERFQDCRDSTAIRAGKEMVGEQYPVCRSHSHLSAQNLFVLIIADRHHCDFHADPADDLERLLNGVVIPFVNGIDELVSFDVVACTVQF